MAGKAPGRLFIGTAGWSIASRQAAAFPADGSHLERYAARFSCAEINSSFHRPHRRQTYEKWAASVPDSFRFSAKLPKTITHQRRLFGCGDLLVRFVEETGGLGGKLAVAVVQLPPSLAFDAAVATAFFDAARRVLPATIACEPRHASWFSAACLVDLQVVRIGADPARAPGAGSPGGWAGLAYWRLHGSPAIYRSSYEPALLEDIAHAIKASTAEGADVWCIFDNTTLSHAIPNALDLVAISGNVTS